MKEQTIKAEQELDFLRNDLNEKNREIHALESKFQDMEDQELDKMEELRKTI